MERKTENSKLIEASAEAIYNAFTDPKSLEVWMSPAGMTGKVHDFNLEVDGGYEMSLFYPESEKEFKGKTSEKEDRYKSRYIELVPNKKIVQAINFDSEDPAFAGEMIMEVNFEPIGIRTKVTFLFRDIPAGIKTSDNELGTISTLEKLARFVEG